VALEEALPGIVERQHRHVRHMHQLPAPDRQPKGAADGGQFLVAGLDKPT
jgi:hypothetical protein